MQLAARHFFLGPRFGISLESLAYTEIIESGVRSMITLLSVDVTMALSAPSLCMRAQNMVAVPRSKAALLSSNTDFLAVCDHMRIAGEGCRKKLEEITKAFLSGSPLCLIGRCARCCTDYTLQIVHHGDSDLVLVITKWLDLGIGLGPDSSRCDNEGSCSLGSAMGNENRKGVVRFRFESASGLSEEELLLRNIFYLEGKRYRGLMDRLNFSTWFLQGGERTPRAHLFRSLGKKIQSWGGLLSGGLGDRTSRSGLTAPPPSY